MEKESLYQELVNVTTSYLGPAAERFITRQIDTHLHKTPDQLTKEDVPKLVDWIKLAIALLTEDPKMVEEFSESLMALAEVVEVAGETKAKNAS